MKKIFLNEKIGLFFRRSYIFIVLAIIYIPLIFIVCISFNGQTDRGNINLNFGCPDTVNYLMLFENNEFINGLLNSLLLSVIVTPICVLLGVITSFGIWKANKKQIGLILMSSKVSLVNPEIITGISLSLLFSCTVIPMGLDFGFFTVVLAHISFCTPYAIIAIYPRMAKMNTNLIYASYDLGCSKMRTFFKVTIPYLLPAILSAVAIVLAMSLDDFIITNLVNGSFQTIGTAIYTTRKGIKAWVVTFGAIIILITFVVMIVAMIVKKAKKNKK